jgi:hypothetical protein
MSATAPDRPLWRRPRAAGLLLLALCVGAGAGNAIGDPRQAYSDLSPAWLGAVGQLSVPGSRIRDGRRAHQLEDCSATLVGRRATPWADTIVTAWHCLEFYNDLSRPITFTLLPGRRGELTREAYRLGDGGGMDADWAILRLYQPVAAKEVMALPVGAGGADRARPVIMAGYSRDEGLGHGGRRLTYDPACRIKAQTPARGDTDCRAHKGASGGAVIQLSPEGEPQFTGVISAGDGESTSIFVPVTHFRATLRQHLR